MFLDTENKIVKLCASGLLHYRRKPKYDLLALDLALTFENAADWDILPFLYLNVGKGYEGLLQATKARRYYQLGLKHSPERDAGGYAAFTRRALEAGLIRVQDPDF